MHRVLIVSLWLMSLVGEAVEQVFGYEVISVSDGGSIVGTVKYTGPRPVAAPLSISKDQEVCGKTEKMNETLLISENQGIQNAVVSLVNIEKGKRFSQKSVTLDQKDCRYTPHILLVPVDSELSILNNDGILHNFHSHSTNNPVVNKAQPKFKKVMKEKFSEPEVIKVTCDAHAWMAGWLVIIEHPYYAVTDTKGNFQLENIPPDKYTLKVWHETLKEITQQIHILPRDVRQINIKMAN